MFKMPSILKKEMLMYVSQSQECLLKAAWRKKKIDEVETSKEYKDTKKPERI